MRQSKRIWVSSVICAAGALSGAGWAADRSGPIEVGGHARSYAIHIPDGSPPPGGFPVVLAFHGGGMQGAGMERITRLDAVADRQRFIAVYPDGVDRHWNDGRSTIRNPQDDVGFVSALLDRVERDYAIDKSRIYATGLSNGALFAERLGCDLSSRIAAIAPVAGTLPVDMTARCRPTRPVAVLQIDGVADPIMPYAGGAVKDFGGRGEGGEVMSVAATAAFWARNNTCGERGAPQRLPVTVPNDPTRIVRVRYAGCPATAPVTVLTILGGGHVWPGGDQPVRPRITGQPSQQINASAYIASFFLALPQRK